MSSYPPASWETAPLLCSICTTAESLCQVLCLHSWWFCCLVSTLHLYLLFVFFMLRPMACCFVSLLSFIVIFCVYIFSWLLQLLLSNCWSRHIFSCQNYCFRSRVNVYFPPFGSNIQQCGVIDLHCVGVWELKVYSLVIAELVTFIWTVLGWTKGNAGVKAWKDKWPLY